LEKVRYDISLWSDFDIYLFKQGNHFNLYEAMGSHLVEADGEKGVYFAVWAPNASSVSVMGDFNNWSKEAHHLKVRSDDSGIWEGFIPGLQEGVHYKYHISSQYNNYKVDKGDPYAFFWEKPPKTASIVHDLSYQWNDEWWMKNRTSRNSLKSPI